MTLIVDSREPVDMYNKLKLKKGVDCKREAIEVGDYLLPDGIAIERKTVSDLVSSLKDNRLYRQLNDMSKYEHPMLVIEIENKWRSFYYSRSRYIHKQWMGTMTTLALRYPNVGVYFVDDNKDFINFIAALYKKMSKQKKKNTRPVPMMRKPTSLKERKENALVQIEGVGMGMAQTLLKKFGSVASIARRDEKTLKQVKGVGKKTAKNIIKTLN